MARVLHWNGKDTPEELRDLPAGRYIVQPLDEAVELTEEEEAGIQKALASLHAGEGRSLEDVRKTINASLGR